jgi:hypothetical protein
MKLNKEKKIFNWMKSFHLLPRSIENVGVQDNGIERDKYVWDVDKQNSDCFVNDVILDNWPDLRR